MPKRLLVVDDDPGVRKVVRDYLLSDGWEVEEANTGTDGLALAQNRSYDIVLMDVKLPDGDGKEFCHRLKSLPQMSRLVVFMMSGYKTETLDKVAGLERGAIDYVTKPLALDELRVRLNAMARALRGGLERA